MDDNTRPWTPFENRCDRCGSESWIRFQRIATDPELDEEESQTWVQEFFFCGHHGRRYAEQLEAEGWDGDDYTSQINEKPSVSANV